MKIKHWVLAAVLGAANGFYVGFVVGIEHASGQAFMAYEAARNAAHWAKH